MFVLDKTVFSARDRIVEGTEIFIVRPDPSTNPEFYDIISANSGEIKQVSAKKIKEVK